MKHELGHLGDRLIHLAGSALVGNACEVVTSYHSPLDAYIEAYHDRSEVDLAFLEYLGCWNWDLRDVAMISTRELRRDIDFRAGT